jgi:hypothetical protein
MRRQLTAEEIAERENDPSELTRVYRHPWITGLSGGVALAAWVLVLNVSWVFAVGVGLAILLWTGLAWRPGGPGQRIRCYYLHRFPKN